MGIIKWNPVRDLLSMQEKMNKIFDDSFKTTGGDWAPAVDIIESEKDIIIIAEIPGVSEEEMEIQVSEGVLSLRGEKKFPDDKQNDSYYRLERSYGKFYRSFAIPISIDPANVKASIKDGVLKIVLSKRVEEKPKTIKVEKEL